MIYLKSGYIPLFGRSGRKAKIYGVSWAKVSNPVMARTDDSIGMVANINGQNDFASAEIFRDFTEVEDSFGNKFVRMPKFYIKKVDGAGFKSIQISRSPFAGAYLPWCFYDFANSKVLDYVDIGKHLAALSADTLKLESKPNKFPANSLNIVQFRDKAKANGAGYQQMDIHAVDVINSLFYVMFANLNSQAIMQGYTTGQYSATHVAVVAGTGVNQIVIANAFANQYRVGQPISIGTTLGGQNVVTDRIITAINDYDASNKAIVFDGAAANIAVGNIVYNVGFKTGWSAPFQIGWKEANDGKSPCAFLGIESIFGDMWQFIDGININERQSWACKNAESYASNLFAAPYEQLGYVTASADGYASEMGFDENLPFAEITKTATGGSPTTFYSDYYYQSTGQRVALLGGSWHYGSVAGLSYWNLFASSSDTYLHIGARLLRKPL